MTIKDYIVDYLPKIFGKHPSWGKVAELVLSEENKNKEEFAHETFSNSRERASFAIPYQVNDKLERERVLNILELILLKHRKEIHKEDEWDIRIEELEKNTTMSPEEKKMVSISPLSFWSG